MRHMKTVLCILCVILAVCCVWLLLEVEKVRQPPPAKVADSASADPPADVPRRPEPEPLAEAERPELLRLRKDNADLLRLRNEVRQLRADNRELSARASGTPSVEGEYSGAD